MDNQKRMLFIAPSPLYLEKGSSLRMYSILKILSEYYKIDLVTYSLGREFNIDNVNVYRTTKWFKPKLSVGKPTISKLILDFLMLLNAIKLSLFNNYNVIHCEDFEGLGIGVLIKFLNKQAKLVYDLHNRVSDNMELNAKKSKLNLVIPWLEKRMIKETDNIILNWRMYLRHEIFSDKKKFIFYDLINLSEVNNKIINDDYIVYAGNFEKYQGVENFLEVYKKIDTNVKVVLIGLETFEIQKFVSDNDLEKKVIFAGKKKIEEANYIIKNAIFAILPRIGGIQPSMKLIHYFVCEKPILASNFACNKEFLIDNYNGLFYSDNLDLKKKIELLISNRSIIENFKIGVKETKNKIFENWDKNKFIEEYEK